jgi:hypothetical protein
MSIKKEPHKRGWKKSVPLNLNSQLSPVLSKSSEVNESGSGVSHVYTPSEIVKRVKKQKQNHGEKSETVKKGTKEVESQTAKTKSFSPAENQTSQMVCGGIKEEISLVLTPSKYNGGQLDSLSEKDKNPVSELDDLLHPAGANSGGLKYIVGIDWAELSLRGDLSFLYKRDEYEKKHFKVSRLDIRTKHFNHAYNLYYRGVLLGTLLAGPRSSVIPVELVQFKIENQFFYKEIPVGKLSHIIKLFLDDFELTFNNYTRLDVYIDFNHFRDSLPFSRFVHLYSSGAIETKGKISKWNPFYSKKDGKMCLTGFAMGSRSSDKFVRCYNKSLEIVDSQKHYIKK